MINDSRANSRAVFSEVLRIHSRIRALFRGLESGLGLSNLELSVLASVAESRSAPTASDLGRSLGHPRQVIQRTVDALASRGTVELRENPEHKRARLVVATVAGMELKALADALAAQIMDRVLGDDQRLPGVASALRDLRHSIDAFLAGGDEGEV